MSNSKILRKLEKTVREIMIEDPVTRGDDDILYVRVLKKAGIEINNITAETYIMNYRRLKLPTIESVGRCRRRVQAKDETLKPTPEIELKRRKTEQSYYYYSIGR
jgi:hypothetical protein